MTYKQREEIKKRLKTIFVTGTAGSGLAEFGIISYLNNLNPFDFTISEGIVGWDAVIGWRIATYYVPIAITWILLVKLALSKIPKTPNE